MSRNVSNAFKQAIYAQQTDECFIVLLTITHPNFTAPILVASDPKEVLPDSGNDGVLSRGMEFIYLPFSISLPQSDETGVARANLSVDNVSREIVNAVRQADSAIGVKIEVIRASDVDNPEIVIENFKLERVTYDAFTVSGDLSIEYFDLEPFPARRFTPSDFPGLF